VTDSLQYDAFGLPVQTASTVTPFRHKGGQGYRTDPDSGLMLLGKRYYDPGLGRFLSRDPAGYAAGDTNLYRYCRNNPVNASDPTGMWIDTALDILSLTVNVIDYSRNPSWAGAAPSCWTW
jgi:RHS repeat-associated protein